jgi:hypothetical protein
VDEVMTDHQLQSAIDSALDELAEARPGPHFVPRLRAHVEQSQRTTRIRGFHLGCAGLVVLVLAFAIGTRQRRDPAPAAHVGQDIALASMPVPPRPARPAPPAFRTARVRPPAKPDVPEVIVPPDQRGAVGRLFAALNAGQPEAVSMMRSVSAGAAAGDAALTVAPIRIDPVIVPPVFDK